MRALGLLGLLLAGCAAAAAPGGAAGPGMVAIAAPGVSLTAAYAVPAGVAVAPAVVALHGCGGPWAARDGQWRDVMLAAGHPVLLPDSFGSRGLGSQCATQGRGISPRRERRGDTVAAVRWLLDQPGTPAGGVVVMGWSNGGSTVLAAAARGVMPPGQVRGYVAFYPGCRAYADRAGWAPGAPMLIVMGEDDDWTPAAPCRVLAARYPGQIKLVLFPGAYHDFDAPDSPVRVRQGLAYTANGNGAAHAGTNPAAREAALRDVPAWIAALPPAPN